MNEKTNSFIIYDKINKRLFNNYMKWKNNIFIIVNKIYFSYKNFYLLINIFLYENSKKIIIKRYIFRNV